MKSRLISAIYFMLDAFIISLVLVFVSKEAAALPVVWNWLLIALLASCISFMLFSRYSYRLVWVIGISIVAVFGMWITGISLWLALILGMLTIYLLHGRYSVLNEEFNHGHHFLMKFTVVFSICWIILLLNPEEQTGRLLFTIVPVVVLFYVASHLLYGYLHSREDGAKLSQAAGAFGIVFSISALAAISTFFVAEEVRKLVGWAAGGAIRIVFWPLALLLEQASKFLSGLSTEGEMQETIDKLGPEEKAAQNDTTASETMPTDFPVEMLLGIVVLVCVIALVLWLRKVKPDSEAPMQESLSSIKRHDHQSSEQHMPTTYASCGTNMNLHQIREVFRDLEQMAKEQDLGRKNYETVREWITRVQWDVTDSFYRTYDRVRYGDKQLPGSQATDFINEIEKIKGKYLKENV
ncbi:hypothetical protein A1A1_15308 [Planococcus antarcticus DSM 14505]|uniref:DUF4129 domain-containing protein n=1 Tax=Planococcus antarcticus DSM 14505 TaxID=1185653 RepID=A0A1C7DG64_9BACL|nr:hypothetical protein [Planococcus antarcticus]ANU10392.1 hypothetical protein BBH88_08790 [Planococcus antarcticus DSM 14505]EIM05608.1 hypothetical protein A1A1_15308 [Planococcus antarcticus DSM 14505]